MGNLLSSSLTETSIYHIDTLYEFSIFLWLLYHGILGFCEKSSRFLFGTFVDIHLYRRFRESRSKTILCMEWCMEWYMTGQYGLQNTHLVENPERLFGMMNCLQT
jgi:hypothetical protein